MITTSDDLPRRQQCLLGHVGPRQLGVVHRALLAHRRVSEKLIHHAAEANLPTKHGDFRIVVRCC